MGGCITVVCRMPDGTTHSLLRHTGQLPYRIHDPRFFKKDESWLQEYIDEKPYLYEKEDDFFQPAAPTEYGIVVIDWKNNKIISANHYFNIGVTYTHQWYWVKDGKACPSEDPEMRQLWEMKKVAGLYFPTDEQVYYHLKTDTTFEQFSEALAKIDAAERRVGRWSPFVMLDMSPFEVKHFETDQEGFEKARVAILEEGIELDLEAWDKRMKFQFEGGDE